LESTLRDRHGPLRAALLTAPLFALQHVSLVAHNGPLAALLVMTVITALAIPFRALIGTAYNATGSLFIAGLVHAMGNATTNGGSSGVGFLFPGSTPVSCSASCTRSPAPPSASPSSLPPEDASSSILGCVQAGVDEPVFNRRRPLGRG
jgi:hypothetical protein